VAEVIAFGRCGYCRSAEHPPPFDGAMRDEGKGSLSIGTLISRRATCAGVTGSRAATRRACNRNQGTFRADSGRWWASDRIDFAIDTARKPVLRSDAAALYRWYRRVIVPPKGHPLATADGLSFKALARTAGYVYVQLHGPRPCMRLAGRR